MEDFFLDPLTRYREFFARVDAITEMVRDGEMHPEKGMQRVAELSELLKAQRALPELANK